MLSLFDGRAIVGGSRVIWLDEHREEEVNVNPNLFLVLSIAHPPCLVLFGTSFRLVSYQLPSLTSDQSYPKGNELITPVPTSHSHDRHVTGTQ